MTKEKICETCKYFRAGLGKCGTGICISDKSLKKNKNCTLRSETCKKWERRTKE